MPYTIRRVRNIQLMFIATIAFVTSCQPKTTLSFEQYGTNEINSGNSSETAFKLITHLAKLNPEELKTVTIPKAVYHFYEEDSHERTYYISNHDQDNPKTVGIVVENLNNSHNSPLYINISFIASAMNWALVPTNICTLWFPAIVTCS